jgi:hypothetical protein
MTKQTLTQSQMPKAPDYAAFIASKVPGDEVLKKLNVFQYHPINQLPPKAKLLSSIWSYQRKC